MPRLAVSGSSLESDLRAAREAKGLSLDDIQSETRIPVHILKQFEDGRLVGDPTYNAVYLKAFLKSYAKAVGVPQAEVLATYEASQGRAPAPAPPPPREPGPARPPRRPAASETSPPVPTPPVPPREEPPTPDGPQSPVAAASAAPAVAAASRPAVSTGGRVDRPPVPGARRSFDKNWGTIIGLFVVIVGVLAAALYFLAFRGDGEPVDDETVNPTGDVAAIDSAGVGAGAASEAPQLQMPIRVTVYAGGNGLQNLRVTEEPAARLGHWIERGNSKAFESAEAVVLWGEDGDWSSGDAVLELQGQRWTPTGAVPLRIDAAGGQQLLDSLAARPAGSMPAIPGPPDEAAE